MAEGMTCYERDETFCEDQMCLRTGCRVRNALGATPPVRGDREAIIALVAKSMRDTWNDYCSDTGCHPNDIEHGRGKILFFEPKHWARFSGEAVADAILSLPVQSIDRKTLYAILSRHIPQDMIDGIWQEWQEADRSGAGQESSFQKRVLAWMMECFSMEICRDSAERNHRFLEESLELVQSLGCTASEAHQLVDYVFGRPAGEPTQELGGVMVTIAALCFPNDLDMNAAAETELARVWKNIDKIRAKQEAKPKHSPLPQSQ